MKVNWYKAITAGLAGTLLFDIVGFIITGQWWDIPALLGGKLGVGLLGGVLGHYSNGIAIAVIYAALSPSLFGPNWFRGISFATVQTIMNVWLLLYPLLGLGIAGIEGGISLAVISLLRHYAFILPTIFILKVNTEEQENCSKSPRSVATASVSAILVGLLLVLSNQETSASEDPEQTRYQSVEINGVDIFYREAGLPENPTLLLLHGFPTSSHMFRNLIDDLSNEYHLVAPDYPGFGNSEQPGIEEFEYSFENLAELIETFTETLELNRYSIYLMDYGAPIGYRLAAKHPERIDALIVQNGNAYEEGLREFWDPIRVYWNDPSAENATPLAGFIESDGVKWQYTHGVRDLETISPDNWNVDLRHLTREGNAAIQLQLFHSYQTNLPHYPAWQQYFRDHQPPTLIVWGKNDYIFPAEGAHPYKRDLKNLEFHLLDTGHFALEEDGDKIAAHIRGFLSRKLPRATVSDSDPAETEPDKTLVNPVIGKRMESSGDRFLLTDKEKKFIESRVDFFLSTVGENDWPYMQHRGGPKGFLKVLSDDTLGFADFKGNRQYISAGNISSNGKALLFLIDYPTKQRVIVWVEATFIPHAEAGEFLEQLVPAGMEKQITGVFTLEIQAYDRNCPKYITQRYTAEEFAQFLSPEDLQRIQSRKR